MVAAKTDPAITPMVPSVYVAWASVMSDLSPVGKDSFNQQQGFKFRGIDQLMNALAGPLRKNGVFIVPRIAHQEYQYNTGQGSKMTDCHLTVEYQVFGPAGDSFTGSAQGEARDSFDKATSKAMAMAFKYFLFQTGMIPLDASSIEDGDRHSPEGGAPAEKPTRSTRNAQQIAEDALNATTDNDLRVLWVEAGPSKRKLKVTDPAGNADPMSLGELIIALRQNLVAQAQPSQEYRGTEDVPVNDGSGGVL